MENITVLLVDDHAMLREGLRSIFQMEPDITVVGEAEDGEAAVHLAEQFRPDVVLMDINLPGIDGIEATRRVKAACPATMVIILTMHDADDMLFAAIREGASGYLLKTLPSREVVSAVRASARGESLLQPSIARRLMEGFATLSKEQNAAAAAPAAGRSKATSENELTPREGEVLDLLVQGQSNREIAQNLFLSDKTVKQHVTKILRKLGVRSRSQAIIHAVKSGLVK